MAVFAETAASWLCQDSIWSATSKLAYVSCHTVLDDTMLQMGSNKQKPCITYMSDDCGTMQ